MKYFSSQMPSHSNFNMAACHVTLYCLLSHFANSFYHIFNLDADKDWTEFRVFLNTDSLHKTMLIGPNIIQSLSWMVRYYHAYYTWLLSAYIQEGLAEEPGDFIY
eukprot:UN02026